MTDFLSALSGLTTSSVLIVLIIVASLLVIMTDWRLLILILGIQYLLISIFLIVSQIQGFPSELAIVKALVGVMIVPVLYISARRARWGNLPRDDRMTLRIQEEEQQEKVVERGPTWLRTLGLPLRGLATLLGVAMALSLALNNPIQFTAFQTTSRDITVATFVLAGQGLLNLLLNENPLKVGLGLLTIMAGFEMFYTLVEPTLLVVALLGLVNLLIALALSYLITAAATPEREVPH